MRSPPALSTSNRRCRRRLLRSLHPQRRPPVNTTAPATSDAQQETPASSSDAPSIGETVKRIIIEINGSGSIDVGGMNEESVLDILTRHAKPVLMSIIKGEIFEEGDLAYDF